jgi:hypothetical protein
MSHMCVPDGRVVHTLRPAVATHGPRSAHSWSTQCSRKGRCWHARSQEVPTCGPWSAHPWPSEVFVRCRLWTSLTQRCATCQRVMRQPSPSHANGTVRDANQSMLECASVGRAEDRVGQRNVLRRRLDRACHRRTRREAARVDAPHRRGVPAIRSQKEAQSSKGSVSCSDTPFSSSRRLRAVRAGLPRPRRVRPTAVLLTGALMTQPASATRIRIPDALQRSPIPSRARAPCRAPNQD